MAKVKIDRIIREVEFVKPNEIAREGMFVLNEKGQRVSAHLITKEELIGVKSVTTCGHKYELIKS